jgi:hypothetical protein
MPPRAISSLNRVGKISVRETTEYPHMAGTLITPLNTNEFLARESLVLAFRGDGLYGGKSP